MIILKVLWFLIFIKLLLFWLWLWQLKQYKWGRLRSHFETQAAKKILSSFWRLKYPKFTLKIIVIFVTAIVLAIGLLLYLPIYWAIILTLVSALFVVLFFQLIAVLWRNFIMIRAKKRRAEFKNLLVIGITGSYGKTSTKEFLATILEEKFGKDKVLKTKEHQNSDVAISRCILEELKPEHKVFVVEMGAYSKGGIKLLADIIKPKIGIVTGVNEQHLSTFGSMENLLSTEGGKELIDSLPPDGIAFFNAKNEYCRDLYEKTAIKKFLYGKAAKNFGEENLIGVKAVAKELGMTDEEIERAAEKIENKLPGMEIKKGIGGVNVIDASYSANPTGVMAHFDYLKTFSGKKVIVMPCLIELGFASKEIHKKIGQKITEVCDLAIITTGDRFAEIKERAGDKAVLIENPQEIFEKIKTFCGEGYTILLEGRVPDKLKWLLIDSRNQSRHYESAKTNFNFFVA